MSGFHEYYGYKYAFFFLSDSFSIFSDRPKIICLFYSNHFSKLAVSFRPSRLLIRLPTTCFSQEGFVFYHMTVCMFHCNLLQVSIHSHLSMYHSSPLTTSSLLQSTIYYVIEFFQSPLPVTFSLVHHQSFPVQPPHQSLPVESTTGYVESNPPPVTSNPIPHQSHPV